MPSLPSIPGPNYSLALSGGVGIGLDILHIPKIQIGADLKSDSKVDLGLNDIRIKELPRIELEFGVRPTRVHFPTHYNLCLSLFGMEVVGLALCGESMVITEPYVSHQTERCE